MLQQWNTVSNTFIHTRQLCVKSLNNVVNKYDMGMFPAWLKEYLHQGNICPVWLQ